MDWVDEFPGGISVCDTEGRMLVINRKEAAALEKLGFKNILGKKFWACHAKKSAGMIREQMSDQKTRVYFTEQNGIRELLIQAPWFEDGKFGGLVEIAVEVEGEIPTIIRE